MGNEWILIFTNCEQVFDRILEFSAFEPERTEQIDEFFFIIFSFSWEIIFEHEKMGTRHFLDWIGA